ncbi:hypothetical protein BC835DRAFT_1369864, partial [Cytidiella melzeri]
TFQWHHRACAMLLLFLLIGRTHFKVIATRALAGDIAGTLFASIVFRTRHDDVEVDFGITISETLAHSVRPLLDKFFHIPEPREF